MPGGDGYTLIRQVRAMELKQGRPIPAAAITAYLGEDREKALAAGFEAHLHKLAQPDEWVEIVAQLATAMCGLIKYGGVGHFVPHTTVAVLNALARCYRRSGRDKAED
ncbi:MULTISPECIES: hypothetical protein [unclassified Leptolyngbya]|uniref:hypothetical protein n=1 Tax=unclassified Leptolyngbya TaxID=2650499 RepID=UPI0018EFF2F4|nr:MULTISPECIES: hypothetical protein [unclassified Leptolyngbya]